MRDLKLLDTRWVLVFTGGISTMNMIIMRTFFQELPNELFDAAKIAGCNDAVVFFRIVLPLSGAVFAVMCLYYAVGHWNSFFPAMIYINNEKLHPLQVWLRKILIMMDGQATVMEDRRDSIGQNVRYATIIVASLPIICFYPFFQRYFVKGVMIGAIKG